jgi:hypothetical protein
LASADVGANDRIDISLTRLLGGLRSYAMPPGSFLMSSRRRMQAMNARTSTPGGLFQVFCVRQVVEFADAKLLEKLGGCSVQHGSANLIRATNDLHQAAFHQAAQHFATRNATD